MYRNSTIELHGAGDTTGAILTSSTHPSQGQRINMQEELQSAAVALPTIESVTADALSDKDFLLIPALSKKICQCPDQNCKATHDYVQNGGVLLLIWDRHLVQPRILTAHIQLVDSLFPPLFHWSEGFRNHKESTYVRPVRLMCPRFALISCGNCDGGETKPIPCSSPC